jgi:hypothetical protein
LNKFNILFKKYFLVQIHYWGLGIGDWGLGPIPNPQSPIPNPQSPIPIISKLKLEFLFFIKIIKLKLNSE